VEIVINNAAWSQSDKEKGAGKLAHKYGLQSVLPSDHPYKSFAPFA
jgi:hypothetical protein